MDLQTLRKYLGQWRLQDAVREGIPEIDQVLTDMANSQAPFDDSILRDSDGNVSVAFDGRTLADNQNDNSVDWQTRQLLDSDENVQLDWSGPNLSLGTRTVSNETTLSADKSIPIKINGTTYKLLLHS
jgi:hypothetical protein